MEVGYDAVGMRDIARAVGKQPPQLYRLQLTKSDILAEIIIELNQEQIDVLPVLLATVEGGNAFERTCSYLVGLYASDIAYKPIRSIGAAFGWTWQAPYEDAVIACSCLRRLQTGCEEMGLMKSKVDAMESGLCITWAIGVLSCVAQVRANVWMKFLAPSGCCFRKMHTQNKTIPIRQQINDRMNAYYNDPL